MPLLGKRQNDTFQTLSGHTLDVLLVLQGLVQRPSFAAFCRRWDLNEHDAKVSAVVTALLHDVGKATETFQQAIKQDEHRADVPHALVALPIVHEVWRKMRLPVLWVEAKHPLLELLAVLSHHSQLYADLYQQSIRRDVRLDFLPEADDFLCKAFAAAAELFGLPDIKFVPPLDWDWLRSMRLRQAAEAVTKLRDESEQVADKVRLKAIYTWLLALLKTSDFLASRHFSQQAANLVGGMFEATLESPPLGDLPEDAKAGCLPRWRIALRPLGDLPEDAKERLLASLHNKPYCFQERLAECDASFVTLMAPCGRGKTEGALLWFLHQRQTVGLDRLVMAMPTQVTSNAMRERLAKLFGEDAVGLYHGKSSLEHRELMRLRLEAEGVYGEDLDPAVERDLAHDENFWGEVMAKPITVTTVDHLLYSFVHGFRQADFALGNLQTAAVVFDEVHYYDRRMLSELRELFKLLRAMQIPHLLMSGTLPSFLIQEAQLADYEHVQDDEGLTFQPFRIQKRTQPLLVQLEGEGSPTRPEPNKSALEEVLTGHQQGLVQFLVVNTVAKAQALYRALAEQLPPGEVWLLHSRFCYAHRREKERTVTRLLKEERKRPLLIVATQVIEVSLDISCDRMFTELAPIDALGQRAGRLNRGAIKPNEHCLIVFQAIETEPYLQRGRREPLPELERTWEALEEVDASYGWIRERCDKVYHDAHLQVAVLPTLFKACALFGYPHDVIRFSEEEGKAYQPRDIHMPTVDVIPQSVLEELGEDGISPLYLAPVPIWWLARSHRQGLDLFYPHEVGKRLWLICRVSYDKDVGFSEGQMPHAPPGVVID